MSYATLDDLRQIMSAGTLAQLTQDDASELTEVDLATGNITEPPIDTTIVDHALRSADELIDSHLRGRYTLPLEKTPTLLRDLAAQIARYRLYSRRPEGDNTPEIVIKDHNNALQVLAMIRNGKISLGIAETGEITPAPAEMRARAPAKQFGDNTWARYG